MSTLALNLPKLTAADCSTLLSQALQKWWNQETSDWDAQVEGSSTEGVSDVTGGDLWGSMPTVDSKAVARTSPIFEEHMGRPLDIRLIRPGGYESVDDMIGHLVPAMMEDSQARSGIRIVK